MNSGITHEEWLRALNDAGCPTESDDRAVTQNEFAAMFGLKRMAARYRLERLVESGKAIRTTKRQPRPQDGKMVMYTAYRLIESPKSSRKRT